MSCFSCCRYQQLLYRNLLVLANLADPNTNLRDILPVSCSPPSSQQCTYTLNASAMLPTPVTLSLHLHLHPLPLRNPTSTCSRVLLPPATPCSLEWGWGRGQQCPPPHRVTLTPWACPLPVTVLLPSTDRQWAKRTQTQGTTRLLEPAGPRRHLKEATNLPSPLLLARGIPRGCPTRKMP